MDGLIGEGELQNYMHATKLACMHVSMQVNIYNRVICSLPSARAMMKASSRETCFSKSKKNKIECSQNL